ncbi:MAG: ATP-binding protein, partial [Magnetococcales bacterium]|nr:ATP-binding protein [Magnetococcales bacterium]
MGKQQGKTGHKSVLIQIAGDHNRVSVGQLAASSLDLIPPKPRGAVSIAADNIRWLWAENRIHPFVGRDDLLNRLTDWLKEEDTPLSVRVITGRGGSGKTRLALELCDRATQAGFQAGFAEGEAFRESVALGEQRGWRWKKPTLVVLDYAASLVDPLHTWFLGLIQQEMKHPLRILLLERHGQPGAGWWQSLFAPPGSDRERLTDGLQLVEPIELPPLSLSERRSLFAEALQRAGSAETIPPLGENLDFDRDMQHGEEWGDPLFLLMAGQWAAANGVNAVLSLTRPDLAMRLAQREGQWITGSKTINEEDDEQTLLRHLAALVTLRGGLDRPQLESLIPAEIEAMACGTTLSPRKLAARLESALGTDQGKVISPIKPDLIGGAFLIQYLGEGQEEKSTSAVLRAHATAPQAVLPRVVRAGVDFAYATGRDFASLAAERESTAEHLLQYTKAPVFWLEALIDQAQNDLGQLLDFQRELPKFSLGLEPLIEKVDAAFEAFHRRTGTP